MDVAGAYSGKERCLVHLKADPVPDVMTPVMADALGTHRFDSDPCQLASWEPRLNKLEHRVETGVQCLVVALELRRELAERCGAPGVGPVTEVAAAAIGAND